MKSYRYGLSLAAREHLAAGQPLTRLEGLILYGVQNLTAVVSDMRRQGWVINSSRVPYAKPLNRIQKFAQLQPPKNLPISEIQVTEYQVST